MTSVLKMRILINQMIQLKNIKINTIEQFR